MKVHPRAGQAPRSLLITQAICSYRREQGIGALGQAARAAR